MRGTAEIAADFGYGKRRRTIYLGKKIERT
jgi:hypothetical protein